MKRLRQVLDDQARHFHPGGRLERLFPLYEAASSLAFSPGTVTARAPHVRDGLDLKRMMIIVVAALGPCIAMALYNTGLQAHLLIANGGAPLSTWQTNVQRALGLGFSPHDIVACIVHGGLYFVPIFLAGFMGGAAVEVAFAVIRRRDVEEGFFVTGFILPLILPPTIPLWQVFLGSGFGILLGKEVFGGTGMNFLNPALVCRALLFFAYPAQMSGEVWIAATPIDSVSGATWLAELADGRPIGGYSFWDAFWGFIPGSLGETSFFACLLGAVLLVLTGVGSWRIMLGVVAGSIGAALLLNAVGSVDNPMFSVPFYWHLVLGGWAFGTAFMATDPVTSPFTERGKLIYGAWIGALVILIRVVNPAYPEGTMLAILFMNMFAPLIDHFIVKANIRRRRLRYERA